MAEQTENSSHKYESTEYPAGWADDVIESWGYYRHPDSDPLRGGGLIYGEDGRPVGYFAHPAWRNNVGRVELKLFGEPERGYAAGHEPEVAVNMPLEQVGVHLPSDSPYEAYTPYAPVAELLGKEYDGSPEMTNNILEPKVDPGESIREAVANLHRTILDVDCQLAEHNLSFSPYSTFASREATPQDVFYHNYILGVMFNPDRMGWSRTKHFVVTGDQIHFECSDVGLAAKTLNAYQAVSHLLFATSLAAPHFEGQVNPNLAKMLSSTDVIAENMTDEEGIRLDHESWLSVRNILRTHASPSGGVYKNPLPETEQAIYEQMDEMLRTGEIPNPSRVAGHHRDRLRLDLGTVEICAQDTAGYNIPRILATTELMNAFIETVQEARRTGKYSDLAEELSIILPKETTAETLAIAHQNTVAVSKEGFDANVLSPDGEHVVTAREQMLKLLKFLKDSCPGRISDETESEIKSAVAVPSDEDFSVYRNEDGITSVYGYYETGKGTFAHWAKRRVKDLRHAHPGWSDRRIIVDCERHAGQALRQHLDEIAAWINGGTERDVQVQQVAVRAVGSAISSMR